MSIRGRALGGVPQKFSGVHVKSAKMSPCDVMSLSSTLQQIWHLVLAWDNNKFMWIIDVSTHSTWLNLCGSLMLVHTVHGISSQTPAVMYCKFTPPAPLWQIWPDAHWCWLETTGLCESLRIAHTCRHGISSKTDTAVLYSKRNRDHQSKHPWTSHLQLPGALLYLFCSVGSTVAWCEMDRLQF